MFQAPANIVQGISDAGCSGPNRWLHRPTPDSSTRMVSTPPWTIPMHLQCRDRMSASGQQWIEMINGKHRDRTLQVVDPPVVVDLTGTAGADDPQRAGGNDTLFGLGGDDRLDGGAGDDHAQRRERQRYDPGRETATIPSTAAAGATPRPMPSHRGCQPSTSRLPARRCTGEGSDHAHQHRKPHGSAFADALKGTSGGQRSYRRRGLRHAVWPWRQRPFRRRRRPSIPSPTRVSRLA